jgi:hypothetical protein
MEKPQEVSEKIVVCSCGKTEVPLRRGLCGTCYGRDRRVKMKSIGMKYTQYSVLDRIKKMDLGKMSAEDVFQLLEYVQGEAKRRRNILNKVLNKP